MIKKIFFYVKNQKITGTLVTPKVPKQLNPGVIFFHGMTSSEKGYIEIANKLSNFGIVSLTISIRGHGKSEGDFNQLTVEDALVDGLKTYDKFTSFKFIDKSRIGIAGTSVGAAIASIIASYHPIKSLVLRVPATYTKDMMESTFREIMDQESKLFNKINNLSDTPAIRAIKKFKGSLLIIPSENDSIIPIQIPKTYYSSAIKARKKEIVFIEKATHNLTNSEWREKYISLLVDWFLITL